MTREEVMPVRHQAPNYNEQRAPFGPRRLPEDAPRDRARSHDRERESVQGPAGTPMGGKGAAQLTIDQFPEWDGRLPVPYGVIPY